MQIELYRKPELETIYPILCSIEKACLDINRLMRRISTDNLSGVGGDQNVQGEDQKKLDVVANRIMKIAQWLRVQTLMINKLISQTISLVKQMIKT